MFDARLPAEANRADWIVLTNTLHGVTDVHKNSADLYHDGFYPNVIRGRRRNRRFVDRVTSRVAQALQNRRVNLSCIDYSNPTS